MKSEPVRAQSAKQKAIVKRFCRTNPPPNKKVALETIDELNADIAQIEAQLDHPDPDNYPSDDEYQAWRHKALGALSFTKEEVKFLEKWLKGPQETEVSQFTHKTLQDIAEKIRARARNLATEIESSYTSCYTDLVQPESLAVAQERMTHLTGIKQRVEGAFTEVTGAWIEYPLRRKDLPSVKAPLQKILTQVEIEIGVVKGYIRINKVRDLTSSWNIVCLKALARAVAEGFILTVEEQAVYDLLCDYIDYR